MEVARVSDVTKLRKNNKQIKNLSFDANGMQSELVITNRSEV